MKSVLRLDGRGMRIEPSRSRTGNVSTTKLIPHLLGQVERTVDDCCRTAIRKRRANASWSVRRGWDLYNPEDKRLSGLSFEDRAALVLDKQAGRGSPWARLISYYIVRNQIAHGTLHTDRIDVAQAIADFYAIGGALTG